MDKFYQYFECFLLYFYLAFLFAFSTLNKIKHLNFCAILKTKILFNSGFSFHATYLKSLPNWLICQTSKWPIKMSISRHCAFVLIFLAMLAYPSLKRNFTQLFQTIYNTLKFKIDFFLT